MASNGGKHQFVYQVRALLEKLEAESPRYDVPGDGRKVVTTDMAADFLRRDLRNNRTISAGLIRRLVNDIALGRWIYDGSPIRFDVSGALIDGQHRLMACVLSGFPIEVYIVTNLSPDAFRVIDTGEIRKGKDILTMSNYKDTTTLHAAARIAFLYEVGGIGWTGTVVNMRTATSPGLVVDMLELNPDFVTVVAEHTVRESYLARSLAGFVDWKTHKIDDELAEVFCRQLFKGVEVPQNSVVFHLRRKFELQSNKKMRIRSQSLLGYVIKAWNHFVADPNWVGRGVVFDKPGEAFPKFAGDSDASRFVVPDELLKMKFRRGKITGMLRDLEGDDEGITC